MSKLKWVGILLPLILGIYCSESSVIDPNGGEDPEPLENKVWVESDTVSAGTRITVDLYFENNEPLSGLIVPLKFQGENYSFDSVSFIDSRFIGLSEEFIEAEYDNEMKTVIFRMFTSMGEEIDTGSGLAMTIHVWVWGSAPTQTIEIDTFEQNLSILQYIDANTENYVPEFKAGSVYVEGYLGVPHNAIRRR